MKQRIITACVLILVCVPVLFLGSYALFALSIAVSMASHYEYISALKLETKHNKCEAYFDIAFGVLGIISAVFCPQICLGVFVVAISRVFIGGILSQTHEESTDKLLYRVWGFYIPAFISLGTYIVFTFEGGYTVMLCAVFSCVMCDTMAYFIGSKFGRHKLCPKISPKKSVEGSVGGFVFSVTTFALLSFIPQMSLDLLECIGAGCVVGIFSQFGDLSASLIKRRFSIKDYGSLLPGHGGILDRIDAILFTYAYMYVYLTFIID